MYKVLQVFANGEVDCLWPLTENKHGLYRDAFDIFQMVKIVLIGKHINILKLNTGNSLSATFERNHCDGTRALFTLIYINMRGS
jgi:hypothetical protein